jgi:response regulator RpfG family c-di-GMP phosphodiesterase
MKLVLSMKLKSLLIFLKEECVKNPALKGEASEIELSTKTQYNLRDSYQAPIQYTLCCCYISKMAAIVAYEHHEKWDGSGYPRGLKEEEIHIFGRITAIADVFDALGSDRVYKKAWEDESIFNLFKEER